MGLFSLPYCQIVYRALPYPLWVLDFYLQEVNIPEFESHISPSVSVEVKLSCSDLLRHEEQFEVHLYVGMRGTGWRSLLRHCATSWKVAGSIPVGVIGIFHWHNPSGRIMALESTQPLTEMSTRNISWGVKAAGAYGWQPYHLRVPIVLKFGSLSLLEPSGPPQACNGIALPLPLHKRLMYCDIRHCFVLRFHWSRQCNHCNM